MSVCAAGPARSCCGYWAKFSRLLSGPGRSAARRVRQEVGGSDGIFQHEKITVGWRAKRCRAAQHKVTGEKEERLTSPGARPWTGSGSGGGSEHQRVGKWTWIWAVALCYRARRGRGLARGRGRGGRGVSQPPPTLSCLFCKRNIKYSFPLWNLPPTLSKDHLALRLTCQPGRRSV